MSAKLANRLAVAAILAATLAAAIAAYLVSRDMAREERDDRLAIAREATLDALAAREDFLRDVSALARRGPGGVAAFARIQARDEDAVVSVDWVRTGAGAAPGSESAVPLVPPPPASGEVGAGAAANPVARKAVSRAIAAGRAVVSPPVELANDHPAFYLAVPAAQGAAAGSAGAGAFVALVDGQRLLARQLPASAPDVTLADGSTGLAAVGDGVDDPEATPVPVANRTWTVSVDGASVSAFETALPWAILLSGFAIALLVALLLGRAVSRRDAALAVARRREDELEQRSREDELTGIFNRRHFTEALSSALSSRERRVATLLLDLDHFKAINDGHGHLTGDLVLQVAAQRLASVVRPTETLARWGGEEFAVLASGLDSAGALALGERLRSAIAGAPIEVKGEVIELSASVGVALADDGVRDPDVMVGAADRALYEAKATGRNRVVIADPRSGRLESPPAQTS
jgi:diguanylate cyclase (GGDEF)-like protein